MRKLKLKQPIDIAVSVFDGIDCLLTNDDLIMHFQAIAENLTPNGLYFVDVTNPAVASLAHYPPFVYSGVRNDIQVDVFWNGNTSVIDLVTGVAKTAVEMRVVDGENVSTFNDVAEERFLNAQEITLLARCSGVMKPIGWYGAYDLNQPLDTTTASERMIAVLQRS